jgi:hypothetical protein
MQGSYDLHHAIARITGRIVRAQGNLVVTRPVHAPSERDTAVTKFSLLSYPLSGLVVRVPDYKSRAPDSIPGATRFSEMMWIWNEVHSAS